VLVLSLVLIIGNQIPDAFAAKPSSITVQYAGTGGSLFVTEDGGPGSLLSPCVGGGCPSTTAVTGGEIITVSSSSGELDSKTHFFINGNEFVFVQSKGGDELHTSCSATQLLGVVGTEPNSGDTITVLSQIGGSGNDCDAPPPPPDIVGGHGGPIDKTALMVTGAQLSASWMIPVLISAIGIGVFVVTRK